MLSGTDRQTTHQASLRRNRHKRTHRGYLTSHSLDYFKDLQQEELGSNEGGA